MGKKTRLPQPTGSGTEEDPWFFPEACSLEEGIGMAYAFMHSLGPDHALKKQFLVDSDELHALEYWETEAGKFWFRYRQ